MPPAPSVVLVVEDDTATRDLLRDLLELEGYTVASAADGAAGVARIEAGGIDLVLLDRRLPDMDGLALCRQVRARPDAVYLPIMMLTAVAGGEQSRTGYAAGVDGYLAKPFDIDELLARVRLYSHGPRSLGALVAVLDQSGVVPA